MVMVSRVDGRHGGQYDSEGIDLILDHMDPVPPEHLPRLVDLVHAEDKSANPLRLGRCGRKARRKVGIRSDPARGIEIPG